MSNALKRRRVEVGGLLALWTGMPFTPISVLKPLAKLPVHVYRWTLKPLVGWECRHGPSCSEYALEAIELNGAWRGSWLALSRISRCRPGGTHGYDPVPDVRAHSYPLTPWRYGRWRAWRSEQ